MDTESLQSLQRTAATIAKTEKKAQVRARTSASYGPPATILQAVIDGDLVALERLCSDRRRETEEDIYAFTLAQRAGMTEAVDILLRSGSTPVAL